MIELHVHRIGAAECETEEYFLPPEKLLCGNPKQTLETQYADASGKFFVGLWRSEPGKWRIAYTEEEYCEMLEGASVITDSQGNSLHVTGGDRFVIPRGFTGTWEVVEPTVKRFVVYEPGPANGSR